MSGFFAPRKRFLGFDSTFGGGVIASGPFSDLLQRLGPGTVPITDVADPLNSFIDPVGGGWITSPPLPFPVAQIDSVADELVWDSTLRGAVLSIAGHNDEFEIEIPYKCNILAAGGQQFTFLNMFAPIGKFPVFSISPGASLIHVELLTSEDGQPDILEASANYAIAASFLIKVAYRRSTNTIAIKVGANAALSAVASQVYAATLPNFVGLGGDVDNSGLFRWEQISSSLVATII